MAQTKNKKNQGAIFQIFTYLSLPLLFPLFSLFLFLSSLSLSHAHKQTHFLFLPRLPSVF